MARPLSAALRARSAARGPRGRRGAGARHRRAGAGRRRADRRHAPGAVSLRRRFPRARRARVHCRGPHARRSTAAAAIHAAAVFPDAGGDGGEVRRPAAGARQQRRDRAALQPDDSARPQSPAALSHARRHFARRSPARRGGAGARAATRATLPR